MDVIQNMAAVAAAMASPSRLKMLDALAGGVARSAIDLAAIAEIQPNTATTHLQALCRADLVKVLKQGRYRYFQIKDQSVGDLIEALGEQTGKENSSRPAPMSDMAFGRTCYDHLAGWLGVRLTESLVARGHVIQEGNSFDLTEQGVGFLRNLGIDLDDARKARRVFARACQDWTEGESHIGGALGAELCVFLLRQKWIDKNEDYREVYVLDKGRRKFAAVFGIQLG